MGTVGLASVVVTHAGDAVGSAVDTFNFTNAAVSVADGVATVDCSNSGGFIDGSLTATKVPKASDANTLTDSNITDDGTNITTGKRLVTTATATGASGFNLPHGTAPTSPVNGDFWTTTAGAFLRANGATQTIISGTGTSGKITAFNGTGTVTDLTPSAAIAQVSGGATQDAEARTALNTLLTQLATMGILTP